MGFMDVFSEQSATPATPSLTQTERFVWDSTIDGPIVSPTNFFTLGTFGTAGKTIGSIRGRCLTSAFAPNFSAITGQGVVFILVQPLSIYYQYLDDDTEDQLQVDGWQVPVSSGDNAQVDTHELGTGPITLDLYIGSSLPGTTWNMTGRIEFIIEWVESE